MHRIPGFTAEIAIEEANPDRVASQYRSQHATPRPANAVGQASCLSACVGECLRDRGGSPALCIRYCRWECSHPGTL